MDFITYLPTCQGFDAILVVVDRLTKLRHYIPCRTTDGAEEVARLFTQNIFRLHGRPIDIVSDRDAKFMSDFWKHLSHRLKIKSSPSTAYHPQTDGQTERMNAILEGHLRSYVSYLQDDWVEWLPLAEFSANSMFSETTGISPFFATYGYQPRLGIEPYDPAAAPAHRDAESFASDMRLILEHLKAETALAQSRYEDCANRRRQPAAKFLIGQEVWLDTRNLKTLRPKKKLDWKNVGPFRVTAIHGPYACRLDLPPSMKIHPVFNVDLLTPVAIDPLVGQHHPPPPPVEVNGLEQFEVEDILDCFTDRRGRGGKPRLRYIVKWTGYDTPT
ncbi:hypothetical protein KC324_g20825, partial [Hortaea werneckii]